MKCGVGFEVRVSIKKLSQNSCNKYMKCVEITEIVSQTGEGHGQSLGAGLIFLKALTEKRSG